MALEIAKQNIMEADEYLKGLANMVEVYKEDVIPGIAYEKDHTDTIAQLKEITRRVKSIEDSLNRIIANYVEPVRNRMSAESKKQSKGGLSDADKELLARVGMPKEDAEKLIDLIIRGIL